MSNNKPHGFCETPEEKCTMNYCDENGCINRKRNPVGDGDPIDTSNNKQSIKLYTEEQVRKAVMIAENQKIGFTTIMIEHLTPIELPSDEEIDEYVKSTGYYGHCTQEYHEGIEDGAKFVINKIQGNNK